MMKLEPKKVIHNFCDNHEIRYNNNPEIDLTRIEVITRTKSANMGVRVDQDNKGLTFASPVDKLDRQDIEPYARLATNNPPLGVSPVVRPNGIVGIQGHRSFDPTSRIDIESNLVDAMGHVRNYIDYTHPQILSQLHEEKKRFTR